MFTIDHKKARTLFFGFHELAEFCTNIINLIFVQRKNIDKGVKQSSKNSDETLHASSLSYFKIMKQINGNKYEALSNQIEFNEQKLARQLESGKVLGLNNNEENELNGPINHYSVATSNYNDLIESTDYSFKQYNKCYLQKFTWLRTLDLKCNTFSEKSEIIRNIQNIVLSNLEALIKEGMIVTEKYLNQSFSSNDLTIDIGRKYPKR